MAFSAELKCSDSSSPGYLTNDYDLTCYDDTSLPDFSLEHYSNYILSTEGKPTSEALSLTYPCTHQLVTLGSRHQQYYQKLADESSHH